MTEREKIIETLRASGYGFFITHEITNADDALADTANALIADGIGNVAEWKRRAEVAERIAREACKIVFSQEIDEEDWENVIYLYKEKHEKYRDEFGITEDMLYDCLKEQADKELAEEGER